MNRVIRTDEQFGSGSNQLCGRLKQHLAHRAPFITVYQALIRAQREVVK